MLDSRTHNNCSTIIENVIDYVKREKNSLKTHKSDRVVSISTFETSRRLTGATTINISVGRPYNENDMKCVRGEREREREEVVNKNCHHYLNVYWKKC